MRPAAPEHKTVYVRFHRRVDELLEEFSKQTGMKRAAAVTWIQNRFLERLLQDGTPIDAITEDMFGFSGVEIPYFIALGRNAEGSVLGRAMQITVDRTADRTLELLAMSCDLSARDFRTAILMQYFEEIGMI
ncbi:MAG: hypothetical protein IKZ09_04410 [Clostridia bacterium]|nr:hypothetical protein [Clostridia bacterium]